MSNLHIGDKNLVTQEELNNTVGDLSSLPTTNKNSVSAAINEIYSNVINSKKKLATAITNKGVSTSESATVDQMVSNINSIQKGSVLVTKTWYKNFGSYPSSQTVDLGMTAIEKTKIYSIRCYGSLKDEYEYEGNYDVTLFTAKDENIDVANVGGLIQLNKDATVKIFSNTYTSLVMNAQIQYWS